MGEASSIPPMPQIVSTGYIHDGYTRDDGYIAPAPLAPNGDRIYGELFFTYRVSSRRQLAALDAEVKIALVDEYENPSSVLKMEDLVCAFIVKQLRSWSLRDIGGHPVPISVESLGRLVPPLFHRLYAIIRSSETSDKLPGSQTKPPSLGEMEKN